MITIDAYLDEALVKQGLQSDRQLAFRLGLNPSTVSFYRVKRSWPTPETMVELAELAERDPHLALIHLGMWKAGNARVAEIWRDVLKKATSSTALTLVLTFGTVVLPGDTNGEQIRSEIFRTIHYPAIRRILAILFSRRLQAV